jgi:hypothetical protein
MNNATADDIKARQTRISRETSFRTPLDALESSTPKLEDWCDLVNNHRQKISTTGGHRNLAQRLTQVVKA